MNKIVNKNDLSNAYYTKQLVKPATDSLQKIDVQSLSGDNEAYQKITDFTQWLNKFVVQANAIIASGQDQYDSRPQQVITAATLRMFAIPELILGEQRNAENKTTAHGEKVAELRKKSFSDSEIGSILPFPQSELDGHTAAIDSLKLELENIKAFLADAPLYDIELLAGVDIDGLLDRCNMRHG